MKHYRNYSEEWLLDSVAYGEHMSAMTGEELHSKSDIAAELAYRDEKIAELEQNLETALNAVERWREDILVWNEDVESYKLRIAKLREVIVRYEREAIEIAKAQCELALEQQVKALEQFISTFPSMLRKMWSAGEVKELVNKAIERLQAQKGES